MVYKQTGQMSSIENVHANKESYNGYNTTKMKPKKKKKKTKVDYRFLGPCPILNQQVSS